MFCFCAAHWPASHSPANHERRYRQKSVSLIQAPCTTVDLVHGVTTTRFVNFEFLAEYGQFDQNGGKLPNKRKNSAKIRMVGSYGIEADTNLPTLMDG